MLMQFEEYLTFENIYLCITFGVLPFWLMLVFIPGSKITQILVNSIIYFHVIYMAFSDVLYSCVYASSCLYIVCIFVVYLSFIIITTAARCMYTIYYIVYYIVYHITCYIAYNIV